MSNSFNTMPAWFDTDTSTAGNSNWRGTSGCTLAGIGSRGIKPTRILVMPAAAGTAVVTGTIVVTDPQSSTALLTIPIVAPAATEPFGVIQIFARRVGSAIAGLRCDRTVQCDESGASDPVSHLS